jgi:hypothetical protein
MTVEPAGRVGQPEPDPAFMAALTTEHFTLQTARAVAVSEENGRTASGAPWPTWGSGTPGPSSCSPCPAPWP